MPKAVSLFSGAGGLDLGFENAGFSIVYACEKDRDSAATWKANRPQLKEVMHVGDIATQMADIAKLKDIDIVFGGPPCQGFSVAGKMNRDDPRNKLVGVFMEVVHLIKPKVFVLENVKSLATSTKWEDVRKSIGVVAKRLGYDLAFDVYKASDYGVPENRERLLLIGVKADLGQASRFQEELVRLREKPIGLREALLGVGEFGTESNPNTCNARITVAKRPVLRRSAYSGMLVNGAGRPVNLDENSQTLTASMGGNSTPIIDQRALGDSSKTNWFELLHDNMSADSSHASAVKVPTYIRRLTLKEAAAIQTFPKDYRFLGHRCSQYRQIGNAVPCRLAELAAMAVSRAYMNGVE